LVTQGADVADVDTAVCDGHSQVAEHLTTVANHVGTSQRLGQRAGQAGPVGKNPGHHAAGVRHDILATHFDAEVGRPVGSLHLRSAPVLSIPES
jgi:hypothetical protein